MRRHRRRMQNGQSLRLPRGSLAALCRRQLCDRPIRGQRAIGRRLTANQWAAAAARGHRMKTIGGAAQHKQPSLTALRSRSRAPALCRAIRVRERVPNAPAAARPCSRRPSRRRQVSARNLCRTLMLTAATFSLAAVHGEAKCMCSELNADPNVAIAAGAVPPPSTLAAKASPQSAPAHNDDGNEYRILLGRATWRLLHTMAARYPDQPTEARKERTRQFFALLGHLYPCPSCAGHLRELLADHPPNVESKEGLSAWMCDLHNKVNVRLGKDTFSCDNIDRFYDCGCELDEE